MKWPINNKEIFKSIKNSFDNNSWWFYKGNKINEIIKLANEKKLKITSGYKVINQDELLFKNFAKNKKFKNADFVQNNILQIRHYDLFQTKKYYEKLFSFLNNLSEC